MCVVFFARVVDILSTEGERIIISVERCKKKFFLSKVPKKTTNDTNSCPNTKKADSQFFLSFLFSLFLSLCSSACALLLLLLVVVVVVVWSPVGLAVDDDETEE